MRWVLIVAGGVLVLVPGLVNPYAPINGATLLGLVLLVWAALRMVKESEDDNA